MKKAITLGLAFVVFLLGAAVPVMADGAVEPSEVNIVLPDGEQAKIEKNVTVPGDPDTTTDVWCVVEAEDGLNVDIAPAVIEDAVAGSTVVFIEEISLDADVEGVACAKVTFYANTYPEEGEEIGTQTICVSEGCLDIKPGSYPNSINRKGNGVVPVALLGSANLDVTTVDVASLAFGPGLAKPVHDLSDPDVYADHLQDVNYDGNLDLVSHYKTKQAKLEGEIACLYFMTVGGDVMRCCDSIRIVK